MEHSIENLKRLNKAGRAEIPATMAITGGTLVNVMSSEIYPADVAVYEDTIVAIGDVSDYIGPETQVYDASGRYLVPGMIDGHIHSECSKMSITSYAKAVVPHGTTSMISGLDEFISVAGIEGLKEVMEEVKGGPLKVFWGAPHKTPYTIPKSTVACEITKEMHKEFQKWPECYGVWETIPEFIDNGDDDTLGAIAQANANGKIVFGCAPIRRGKRLNGYLACGIRLDHESYDHEEVVEKMRNGLFMLLRESCVTQFMRENIRAVTEVNSALARRVSFCTDDMTAKYVRDHGHLDNMVRIAMDCGVDAMTAIQMATVNSAEAYRIDHLVGAIVPGRLADILLIDDLEAFNVKTVFVNGKKVAENGSISYDLKAPARSSILTGELHCDYVSAEDFKYKVGIKNGTATVLSMDGKGAFVRKRRDVELEVRDGVVIPDPDKDVAVVSVLERHGRNGNRAIGFCSGWTMKKGAMASSSAPDDNNIVVMGVDPDDMALAVNYLIKSGGGQIVVEGGRIKAFLPLPIGGIACDLEPEELIRLDDEVDAAARELGCLMEEPMYRMCFMVITAVPDYGITDLGPTDCVTLEIFDPILKLKEV